MKKIIALSVCLILVLSLCACGAKEDLTGKWTATINMADSYNAELNAADPATAQYLALDRFDLTIIFEFKDDGTYLMTIDRAAAERAIEDVIEQTRIGMEAYFTDLLIQEGVDMELDEALELLGVSMDDLVNELTATLDVDAFSEFTGEGCWKADDGKLYITESVDAPAVTIGEYNTYVLEGDTLTLDIGTETLDEETAKMMFPMVLTRIN